MSSISFHLKSCPQMNNLTSVCTHRQAHCSTAIIHSRFIMFLAKLLQHLLLQDIFILLIFPVPVLYLLFFSSFKHSLQVSKRSAMLDQWPPLCCQRKTASKAKSKQSSCAEGLIKAYNWITPPWAVCGTMPTHLPFVYRLMVKRMRKKDGGKQLEPSVPP